ncbi:MAG TPA: cupin domain-containing protein [Chloroflexota bacterium]|nr:cupin domain-containing protein [Chloroflexota bacterium]
MADQIEVKSHSTPDEVRTPDKTRVELVRVGGSTLGRLTLQPGWKWSECIKPVVHTESCQVHHVGYALSGSITVRLTNGNQATIKGGDSYDIPPGHDAWVDGPEPFVGVEVQSAEQYARPS